MSELSTEVSLVGPFSARQRTIIAESLFEQLPVNIHSDSTTPPEGAIVAVRGGIPIVAERDDLKWVISAGRGVDNIDKVAGRNILDCRGENAPETASHGVALAINALKEVYGHNMPTPQKLNTVVVGPGYVGVHAAALFNHFGFPVKMVQREGKDIPAGLERYFTNDLSGSIADADIILFSATAEGIINQENVEALNLSSGRSKIIVNVARADIIDRVAFTEIRSRINNKIRSDVWYDEPQQGDHFPLSTAVVITGYDEFQQVLGTMHLAAQQESSNIAVARRLSTIINTILKGDDTFYRDDPIAMFRILLREIKDLPDAQINKLLKASDVKRVQILTEQLTTIAATALIRENVLWNRPPVISPKHGEVHDFVKILRANK